MKFGRVNLPIARTMQFRLEDLEVFLFGGFGPGRIGWS